MTSAPIAIYSAGPGVFRKDVAEHALELKDICKKYKAECLFPLDADLREFGGVALPKAIRLANEGLIRRADAVVADMDTFRGPSMDGGTAYEMGFAVALGKLVVGYTSDRRSYLDKVKAVMPLTTDEKGVQRDARGMMVEEFGDESLIDNLMMADGARAIVGSFEEAVRYVVWKMVCVE